MRKKDPPIKSNDTTYLDRTSLDMALYNSLECGSPVYLNESMPLYQALI